MSLSNIYKKQFFNQILIWLVLLSAAVLISVLFPVYFRNDDGTWLFWASSNRLFEAFIPDVASFGGTFRPINYVFWWIMFRVAGYTAIYYQILVVFIFLANLYLFYLLSKEYLGQSTAIASIGFHILFFQNLYYVAFWFSDTTFTLQLFFAFLSILFYLKSKKESYKIIFSYLFAILAFLTKEPAILIVIVFVISDMAINSKPNISLRPYVKVIPYIFFAAVILIVSPVTESRPMTLGNLADMWSIIGFRGEFYYEYLRSGARFTIPLLLGLLALGVNGIKSKWLIISTLILAVASVVNWIYFYTIILILSFAIIRNFIKLLPPFIWFIITLFPLFMLSFYTPTYLYEFSFGFSMFMGAAIVYVNDRFAIEAIISKNPRHVKLAIAVVILPLTFVFFGQVRTQVKALNRVVEARQNFAAAMEYIQANSSKFTHLIVIDRRVNDDLSNKELKLASALSKANQQQTMEIPYIQNFIDSFDGLSIKCNSLHSSTRKSEKTVLLLQNNYDIKAAKGLGVIGDTMFIYSYFEKNYIIVADLKLSSDEPR